MLILVAALALLPACEDDPVTPPPVEPVLARQPLTSRAAILNNIEYAYKARRGDVLHELLDDEFVFYFAPGDVGGEIPPSWGRTEEYETTNALFESNTWTAPAGPICRSIRVDLQFNAETEWAEVLPESAPGETWYTAEVFYSFTFEMEPDNTYIAQNGAKAEFTVRQVGDEWRLVEWHDLGSTIVTASNGAEVNQSTSWGGIKALYR
jgi:hypothetical protein